MAYTKYTPDVFDKGKIYAKLEELVRKWVFDGTPKLYYNWDSKYHQFDASDPSCIVYKTRLVCQKQKILLKAVPSECEKAVPELTEFYGRRGLEFSVTQEEIPDNLDKYLYWDVIKISGSKEQFLHAGFCDHYFETRKMVENTLPMAEKFYQHPLLNQMLNEIEDQCQSVKILKRDPFQHYVNGNWKTDFALWVTPRGLHAFQCEGGESSAVGKHMEGMHNAKHALFSKYEYRDLQSKDELIAFAFAVFCKKKEIRPGDVQLEYLWWGADMKKYDMQEDDLGMPRYYPSVEEPRKEEPVLKDFF